MHFQEIAPVCLALCIDELGICTEFDLQLNMCSLSWKWIKDTVLIKLWKYMSEYSEFHPGFWWLCIQPLHRWMGWKNGTSIQPVQSKTDWAGSSSVTDKWRICCLSAAKRRGEIQCKWDKECFIYGICKWINLWHTNNL